MSHKQFFWVTSFSKRLSIQLKLHRGVDVECYNPQGSQELNGVRTWGSEDLGLVKVKISPLYTVRKQVFGRGNQFYE